MKKIYTLFFAIMATMAAFAQAGNYTGKISINVGGLATYTCSDVLYKVTVNDDKTINVEMSEYSLSETIMGDLTIGTYTVSNIAYDAEQGAYYRDYSADGLKAHFKAVSTGVTTMNNDYALGVSSATGTHSAIKLVFNDNKVDVTNTFILGSMPFDCVGTYSGIDDPTLSIYQIADTPAAADKNINGQAYTIAGQRAAANHKGLVIINGKKYMAK